MLQDDCACYTSRRETKPGPIDRCAVIQDLHLMIGDRLFGDRPWLADRESCAALNKTLDKFGLQERVPGMIDTTRCTKLGAELNLDLMTVFMGLLEECSMVEILEYHGLIDKLDASRIYNLLETCRNPELVLRPIVKKAFHNHFNPSGLLV
jgi:hypothetical protein